MRKLFIVAIILILGIGGWFVYTKGTGAPGAETLYAYSCENSMQFNLSPAEDYSWLAIFPGKNATFSQETLSYRDNVHGMHYMGVGSEITASDTGVILGLPSGTTSCAVAEGSAALSWNVDATDIEVDNALTVSESIVGKWQGVGETTIRREFKQDGTYVDTRDGKQVAQGLWFAFSPKNAPEVPFDLGENNVYLQLAETNGGVAYLRVTMLTLGDLTLVYMDRPGVLMFKLVK